MLYNKHITYITHKTFSFYRITLLIKYGTFYILYFILQMFFEICSSGEKDCRLVLFSCCLIFDIFVWKYDHINPEFWQILYRNSEKNMTVKNMQFM